MNFILIIIGVVFIIYQFNKEHKGDGFFSILFSFLGILSAVIAVPQLIGYAIGAETGMIIGRIIGFSVLLILIIALFIYSRF